MNARSLDPARLEPQSYPLLSFNDAEWEWFRQACALHNVEVESGTRERLEAVYSHLCGVNQWMNLTRITDPLGFLKLHVLDSLTVRGEVHRASRADDLCVDLGSGAGYPGLPLAIWLPDRRWVLVDSRSKKAAFLARALELTGCRRAAARAFRGREAQRAAPDLAGACRVVLARAIGRVEGVLVDASCLLRRSGTLILMKGPAYADDERDAALACHDALGFERPVERGFELADTGLRRTVVTFRKVREPRRVTRKQASDRGRRRPGRGRGGTGA